MLSSQRGLVSSRMVNGQCRTQLTAHLAVEHRLRTEVFAAGGDSPEALLEQAHWTALQKMLNEEKPH